MSHLSIKEKDPIDDEFQALTDTLSVSQALFKRSVVLILSALEKKKYYYL